MIELKKVYRGKETVITRLNKILIDSEGNLFIKEMQRSDNYKYYCVEITPKELRELRDKCNEALSKITGYDYKTTVTIK